MDCRSGSRVARDHEMSADSVRMIALAVAGFS